MRWVARVSYQSTDGNVHHHTAHYPVSFKADGKAKPLGRTRVIRDMVPRGCTTLNISIRKEGLCRPMTAHKCLTCTGEIKPGQDEEKITGKTSMLYMHAHYQDCQAELAGPSATAAALRSYRIRQDDGLVRRHQSVASQEMQDRDRTR